MWFMNDDSEYIERSINEREYAESLGFYIEPEIRMTERQEYETWQAVSSLSEIAKQLNSSISDLINMVSTGNV